MNSFEHKWIIENFSLFHKENVDHKFSLSKNVSKFDSNTNSFSHNNRCILKESNNTLNRQFVYSPNFGSKTKNEKCYIYLELCPNGFDENSKDFLSIFINLRSFRDCELEVRYKVFILNKNGQPNDAKEDKGNLGKSARFGWKHFIWLESLKSKFLINDTLTIYCEVHLSNKLSPINPFDHNLIQNIPKLSYFNVKTQKTVKSFAHQWTIENVTSIFNSNSKHLINSHLFPNVSNDVQFSLCLYPRGLNEEKDEYLLIYLNINLKIPNQNEIAYFRVSLLDPSTTMNKILCRGAPIKITNFDPNRKTWGWHLIKREELLDLDNKFVFQNNLTIYCEVLLQENGLKCQQGQILNLRPNIIQTSAKPITQKILPNSVNSNTKPQSQSHFHQANTQKGQQQSNLTKTSQHSQSQMQLNQTNPQKNSIALADQKFHSQSSIDLRLVQPKNQDKPKITVTDMSKYKLKPIEANDIASSTTTYMAHKWVITNFSLFYEENANHSKNDSKFDFKTTNPLHNNDHPFIYSPNFASKSKIEKCNIYLELCPNGFDKNSKSFLSIFINLRSFRDGDLAVKYKVSILDQHEQPIFLKEDKDNLIKSARFGWESFTRLQNLKKQFLFNDTLTIFCEVHLLSKLSLINQFSQNLSPNVAKPSGSYLNVNPQTLKSFAHQWTIENVNSILFNPNSKHLINSQIFPNASNDVQFSLCLYPRGLKEETDEYLLVCFNGLSRYSNSDSIAYFRVSVLDPSTKNKLNCIGAPIKVKNRKTWGWHLIKREELLNKFVFQDKFTIYCEVWLFENELKPGPSGQNQDIPNYKLRPMDESKMNKISSNTKSLSTLSLNSNKSISKEKAETKISPGEIPKQENKSDAKQKQELPKKFENNIISNSMVFFGSNTVTTGNIGIKSIDKTSKMACTNQNGKEIKKKRENNAANVPVPKNVIKNTPTIKKLSGQYMWSIPDFIARCKPGDQMESEMFWPHNYSDIKFYLQLCPNGIGDGKDSHVSFRLFLHECDRKEINVKAILSIIKTENNNEELNSKPRTCEQLARRQSIDWSKYAVFHFIKNKNNGFLPNDKLTMRCKYEVFL